MDFLGAPWRKSSFSGDGGQANCVEVALAPGAVAVRDSKNPRGPHLLIAPSSWRSFTNRIL
ncbi:DUF397 domain-containing protein [Tamaricihabitans halophyticus]|uniref:DUF397 domain-containing protein n=1 Tax=Tamaricihabitans halophyticus TaxID=1262583 RepID=UPI00104A9D10|nr:DUF397 domain-containing protein [Tamaricihabitans halophyticus]